MFCTQYYYTVSVFYLLSPIYAENLSVSHGTAVKHRQYNEQAYFCLVTQRLSIHLVVMNNLIDLSMLIWWALSPWPSLSSAPRVVIHQLFQVIINLTRWLTSVQSISKVDITCCKFLYYTKQMLFETVFLPKTIVSCKPSCADTSFLNSSGIFNHTHQSSPFCHHCHFAKNIWNTYTECIRSINKVHITCCKFFKPTECIAC